MSDPINAGPCRMVNGELAGACHGCAALSELAKLRALCAARPKLDIMDHEAIRWIRDIDAAGRGEDEE